MDAASGRHYLLITDEGEEQSVKTSNAIRQVPIHQKLLDSGFLNFVAGIVTDRLFHGLSAHQVTGWYSRFRDNLDISPRDDYGNRKVFHSWRHTLITKARAAGVSLEQVQQVVGHEKTSAGVTDRYTGTFPLKDVLGVVDAICYDG